MAVIQSWLLDGFSCYCLFVCQFLASNFIGIHIGSFLLLTVVTRLPSATISKIAFFSALYRPFSPLRILRSIKQISYCFVISYRRIVSFCFVLCFFPVFPFGLVDLAHSSLIFRKIATKQKHIIGTFLSNSSIFYIDSQHFFSATIVSVFFLLAKNAPKINFPGKSEPFELNCSFSKLHSGVSSFLWVHFEHKNNAKSVYNCLIVWFLFRNCAYT